MFLLLLLFKQINSSHINRKDTALAFLQYKLTYELTKQLYPLYLRNQKQVFDV